MRHLFAQRNFDQALSIVTEGELKKDKKNKLLYLMEQGTLYYYKNEFKKASVIFVEANELVDKLYTKSIREKIASSILNDNSETFYGSIFERSLLYYYQAMSFYQLALAKQYTVPFKNKEGITEFKIKKLTKNEIKKSYDKVRSTLIAWDSFFKDLRRTIKNKTILTQDLLSKMLAAQLHERLGTRRDHEISMILYQDALKLLVQIGPAYNAFNKNFKKYNLELKKKLSTNKKVSSISSKYKDLRPEYEGTLDFIKFKILKFYKLKRKYQYRAQLKKLKPSKTVIKELKALKKGRSSFLLEIGQVQELQGHDYILNLRTAIEGIEDPGSRAIIEGIGVPILTYFAAGPLGLGYVSHHGNVSIYSRHNAGEAMVKEIGLEFEMPKVSEPIAPEQYFLQFKQNDKIIKEQKLEFIAPISGNAFISNQESIENAFKSRSVRIGVKYALAIAAAYGTYKKVQETSGELFAKPAAMAQFLLSQKGIKASESADIRHWTTVPANIVSCDISLDAGEYEVIAVRKSEKGETNLVQKLGAVSISKDKESLFSYRLF